MPMNRWLMMCLAIIPLLLIGLSKSVGLGQVLLTSLILFSLGSLALGLGRIILNQWPNFKVNYSMSIGLAYALGFMVIGMIGVVLGTIGQFKPYFLITIFSLLLLACNKIIYAEVVLLQQHITNFFISTWCTSKLRFIVLILLSMVVATNYLAINFPPLAPDELAYHLPEAQVLLTSHQLDTIRSSHFFYGNLPVFMEVITAIGLVFRGSSVVHGLQFFLFLALLLFIFGWLRQQYNHATAFIGIALLFSLNEILALATTGYVDTAEAVFEVMAIILVLEWIRERKPNLLILSGLLFGTAISIKYTALISIGLFGSLITVIHFFYHQEKFKSYLKNIIVFVTPILLVGGIWYVKNMLLYHNPFYPLYFGHSGVDEASYRSVLEAIQSFVYPRTLSNFLLIPLLFFWIDTPYQFQLQAIIILLCLTAVPRLLYIQQQRLIHIILGGYSLIYTIYWFFWATHQVRFLAVPTILLTLLGAIAITLSTVRQRLAILSIFISICIGFNLYLPKASWRTVARAIITIDWHVASNEHVVLAPLRLDAVRSILWQEDDVY